MGRTLYLTETEKFRCTADGPSIWIDWEKRAGQRVPLRLISRCIIVGNIHLESGLICLLASNNIPIIFTNASGHELAIAVPYNHHLPRYWRDQRVFLETRKNRERFIDWARIKRMVLQLSLLRLLFPERANTFIRDISERDYQELVSSFKPREEAKWKTVKRFIENLFRSLIIESLVEAKLNLDLGIIHRYHNLGLALDFGYVLEPRVDEQGIEFFRDTRGNALLLKQERTWCLTKEGVKEAIQRFEKKREENEDVIANTLDEFFLLMRELRS
ncbi:MAG: CRISPR-associated endonuclease Cas1 [Clostridiales bacterium]|nr:CRISPR-associated endonuclease Cas1 [Clostridiales bacterium]